ncbi:MAG: hypothetical protein IANPNBLG_02138 [Bryobacteraceae bacterium]|nr:hypothetical protein [Bryobacteraceae bacterium]
MRPGLEHAREIAGGLRRLRGRLTGWHPGLSDLEHPRELTRRRRGRFLDRRVSKGLRHCFGRLLRLGRSHGFRGRKGLLLRGSGFAQLEHPCKLARRLSGGGRSGLLVDPRGERRGLEHPRKFTRLLSRRLRRSGRLAGRGELRGGSARSRRGLRGFNLRGERRRLKHPCKLAGLLSGRRGGSGRLPGCRELCGGACAHRGLGGLDLRGKRRSLEHPCELARLLGGRRGLRRRLRRR